MIPPLVYDIGIIVMALCLIPFVLIPLLALWVASLDRWLAYWDRKYREWKHEG